MTSKAKKWCKATTPNHLFMKLCEFSGLRNNSAIAKAIGVHPSAISQIMSGQNDVTAAMILHLVDNLGVSVMLVRKWAGITEINNDSK